jgi:hypothetical protein
VAKGQAVIDQEKLNTPEPEQIFTLAGLCMELGKTGRNSLRRQSAPINNFAFRTDFLRPPDQTFYDFVFDEENRSVSRQYVGYVALVRFGAWKLQIKEDNLVFSGSRLEDKCQIVHLFNWSSSRVMRASKFVHHTDFEEDFGESLQLPSLDDTAFQPDFLGAVSELHPLKAGDCDRLISDIQHFSFALECLK